MAKARSFSIGVDNLLERLRPHSRPATAFPVEFDVADARRAGAETVRQWFMRLVDKYCGGDPALAAIESNIAVFAKLKWNRDRLVYATMPTLIAECDLEEYYQRGNAEATYLRLDLDYATLGDPFSHPLPHVHASDERHPRFCLEGGTSGNVIVDYLEFVYRNYAHDRWLDWARRQWISTRGVEADEGGLLFRLIVEAFLENQFHVLRANAHAIAQIKKTLRDAKDSMFRSHMDGVDREILEYPLAR